MLFSKSLLVHFIERGFQMFVLFCLQVSNRELLNIDTTLTQVPKGNQFRHFRSHTPTPPTFAFGMRTPEVCHFNSCGFFVILYLTHSTFCNFCKDYGFLCLMLSSHSS